MGLKVAICACLPFPTSQGSQVLTHAVAQSLSMIGCEVHLLTYAYGESRVEMNYRHHTAGRWVPSRKLRAGPSIWKPVLDSIIARRWLALARDIGADVLHAINYEAVLAGLWVRKRYAAPLVASIHGLLDEELPFYFRSRRVRRYAQRFGLLFTQKALPGSDAVLTLNPRDAKRLVELGLPEEKVMWHYPSAVIGDIPDRAGSRRLLGWRDEKVVLYAGNLDRYQGLDVLFSAFRELAKRHDRLLLAVATTSDPKPVREALGDLQSRVRILFTHDFEEIKRAIVACDAFVIARTVRYGFPIKLLNALALGAPVVIDDRCAYGVKSGEEVLTYDGTPGGLASSLERVLFDAELADNIRRGALSASRRFSLEGMGSDLKRCYEQVLSRVRQP
ncbi:MAG TPA: glycosyltransferase [Proteobacteria bacterium]|nr:glycosyltransferase [Pseudomonadota bacterium]